MGDTMILFDTTTLRRITHYTQYSATAANFDLWGVAEKRRKKKKKEERKERKRKKKEGFHTID